MYQLINAINIKTTFLKDEKADVLLNNSTDFSVLIPKLKKRGIFSKIIISEDSLAYNERYWKLSREEKKEISRNPSSFIYRPKFEEKYTDFYIGVYSVYAKLLYYYLIQKGMKPKIHFFEESHNNYTIDLKKGKEADGMVHEEYKENNFYKNIVELLLYRTDLYSGTVMECPLVKMKQIDYKDPQVRGMYNEIFGYAQLPKEKYIFLEEPFFEDRKPSSDMDLLEGISKIIGKDNLIVKMHPRNQIDRFSRRGFKTMTNSLIPWEVMIMNTFDIEKKVLLSVNSNSSISAKIVFDRDINTIHLYKMILFGKSDAMMHSGFKSYYTKLYTNFNIKRKNLYAPNNINEFIEVIKYINGRINNE